MLIVLLNSWQTIRKRQVFFAGFQYKHQYFLNCWKFSWHKVKRKSKSAPHICRQHQQISQTIVRLPTFDICEHTQKRNRSRNQSISWINATHACFPIKIVYGLLIFPFKSTEIYIKVLVFDICPVNFTYLQHVLSVIHRAIYLDIQISLPYFRWVFGIFNISNF